MDSETFVSMLSELDNLICVAHGWVEWSRDVSLPAAVALQSAVDHLEAAHRHLAAVPVSE